MHLIGDKLKQAREDLENPSMVPLKFAELNGVPIRSKSLLKISGENVGAEVWLDDEVINYMCEVKISNSKRIVNKTFANHVST